VWRTVMVRKLGAQMGATAAWPQQLKRLLAPYRIIQNPPNAGFLGLGTGFIAAFSKLARCLQ